MSNSIDCSRNIKFDSTGETGILTSNSAAVSFRGCQTHTSYRIKSPLKSTFSGPLMFIAGAVSLLYGELSFKTEDLAVVGPFYPVICLK